MDRAEFEELAGIGRTTFYAIVDDPAVRQQIDYQPTGMGARGHMDRKKALAYIRARQLTAVQAHAARVARFGPYVTRPCTVCGTLTSRRAKVCSASGCGARLPTPDAPPPRGRPCPHCRRRITRKACTCRWCGELAEAAPGA